MENTTKSQKNEKQENTTVTEDAHVSFWKIWTVHSPWTIPSTQYTWRGYSVAALRTNFYIKELGVMLDAGLSSPNFIINHWWITHPHSDHVANIPYHIYSYRAPDKIQIYIPKGIETLINSYIESAYLLSSYTFPEKEGIKREELYLYGFYDWITVEPGQIIPITIKKKPYSLEVFKCDHIVPCVGYGWNEKKTKWKEEYLKLSGKEIGELKKKGVEITKEVDNKIICYLGNTSKEIFEGEQWKKITEYKTIIIECTFIKDEDLAQASKTHHIHWNSIEPVIDWYKDNIFVLIHFSQRYLNHELEEFFHKVNKSNVIPWIN